MRMMKNKNDKNKNDENKNDERHVLICKNFTVKGTFQDNNSIRKEESSERNSDATDDLEI
jgi:hypothetical protein